MTEHHKVEIKVSSNNPPATIMSQIVHSPFSSQSSLSESDSALGGHRMKTFASPQTETLPFSQIGLHMVGSPTRESPMSPKAGTTNLDDLDDKAVVDLSASMFLSESQQFGYPSIYKNLKVGFVGSNRILHCLLVFST
ncbi:hypothetical protein HK096_010091 [Nowakowskiella sp. JEL0078]|nr:hypothetical protein HK096_010091 [Nowakowskiella sp. JEL0078]